MFFDQTPFAQPDPIFGLKEAFLKDSRKEKVDLSLGVYKNPDLTTPLMEVVSKAEAKVLSIKNRGSYLPIQGDAQFIESAAMLLFGEGFYQKNASRIFGAQSVGGTGALFIAGRLLHFLKNRIIHLPAPTWANHAPIFEEAGINVAYYPYYSEKLRGIDIEKTLNYLQNIPEKSAVLLHASSHNPTGVDFSSQEFAELSNLLQKKEALPIFDVAYQGLGNGIFEDVASLHHFMDNHSEIIVTTTFSKNFSLYRERIGAVFALAKEECHAKNIGSQIKSIIRRAYSNPPFHGASIVHEVLSNPSSRKDWEKELAGMREHIKEMRSLFIKELACQSADIDFAFLEKHQGMFSFCNLKKDQVLSLRDNHAIYMPDNGRINICGLTKENIGYVANAITGVSKR